MQETALFPAKSVSTRRRGKPTKYSPELAKAILDDIRRGVPVTKAFAGNSIGQTTGYVWTYQRPEFAIAVQAARSHYRMMCAVRQVLVHGSGNAA